MVWYIPYAIAQAEYVQRILGGSGNNIWSAISIIYFSTNKKLLISIVFLVTTLKNGSKIIDS
jgi:hypothetical protein